MAQLNLLSIDQLALERILSFLPLNDLWALETAARKLKHLTGRIFERVHTYPVEGKNYRFKKYNVTNDQERIAIRSNSYIQVVARCTNLKELRLMHPLEEPFYECGLKIGESCLQLEKILGSYNNFQFVQGIMDGLLENVGYDEVKVKELTLQCLENARQLKALHTWVNSCPHLVKVIILMANNFDMEDMKTLRLIVERPTLKIILPTSMQHKLERYRRDEPIMRQMLLSE